MYLVARYSHSENSHISAAIVSMTRPEVLDRARVRGVAAQRGVRDLLDGGLLREPLRQGVGVLRVRLAAECQRLDALWHTSTGEGWSRRRRRCRRRGVGAEGIGAGGIRQGVGQGV